MIEKTAAHVCAVICILALSPVRAFAWSVEAHQAIALIAENRLQGTAAATRIASLLGSLSLEDIAVCPDQLRELERHEIEALSAPCGQIFPNHPTGTAPWHFVNTPVKGPDFTPTATDVNAICKKTCAVVQIQKFLAVLSASKSTDTAAKKIADRQALSFLVHFIGDVHQPLHSADRGGDAGGNAEHVTFFDNSNVPLHTIWDNQIVVNIGSTPTALVTDLAPEISAAAAEPQSTPVDWTLEAYLAARDVAYQGIPNANGANVVATLAEAYQTSAAPVVRVQIARAGVRLAESLQAALK